VISGVFRWAPAGLFLIGAGLVSGLVAPQREMPLRAPLAATVPDRIGGYLGEAQEISDAEAQVAGMSNYLLRMYTPEAGGAEEWVSVYVGYYESQMQGRTIHSPKNCLPGSGWEPLRATVAEIPVDGRGAVEVNRYILQRGEEQALVLYWYQGRGRIEDNEYRVKFDLLKDAALKRRSDEALVRVVVPVAESEESAYQRAQTFAGVVIQAVGRALPDEGV